MWMADFFIAKNLLKNKRKIYKIRLAFTNFTMFET